ncbi:lipase family protein [Pseudomonas sp. SWRI92]|uniref:lipase family protein n=1 Tax=Pseudomonas sp. SWRI92 TaxID=2745499 RepID=UPI0016442647|nr:lipase family protein [Pseudomonas sp. SWRI92]MBC3373014.1 lipase family protein [Pseudomonas sp. SWRI92]
MTLSKTELESRLSSRIFACPVAGKWTSFQLVDESGAGEPYAWLAYVVTDSEGQTYRGNLDASGVGKVDNHFAGPIALTLDDEYQGQEQLYIGLQGRDSYPLKITELQVRAEKTRYLNDNATRTRESPAQACAGQFFQVEVRDLVKHVTHLPPQVYRHYPPNQGPTQLMGEFGTVGVALMPQGHTVLEVRPLRALRPMLSSDPEFCALNLYQLALMATLSYCPFGQQPGAAPINTPVSFPEQPSVGNWFGDALAKCEELWRVDPGQTKPYYPLYEDVPYSKRLEIVPFDPALYPVNNPELGTKQEHPAKIHFLDDTATEESTDTQAFITHNDEVILIAVRGTAQMLADGLRDADALQVPFEEGLGKVHRGFYGAAKKSTAFVTDYLDRFYAGQKLLICGHSLGGAVALLLAEMLRLRPERFNIQLYTYGAPRAADASFVKNAEPLVHYRMVNHNDPIPSVPGSWMDTKTSVYGTGLALTFVNVPAGFSVFVAGIYNWTGEPYGHHGTLRHFLPVEFSRRERSSILWTPGCDTLTQHAACEIALQHRHGLPDRPGVLAQLFQAGNHLMTSSYVPACWATLRRWQEAQESGGSLVTPREYERIEQSLAQVTQQLRNERRHILARPDAYVRAHQPIIEALSREVDKVQATHARLTALSTLPVNPKDVYGSLSENPDPLAQNLARWQAHPENRVAEQLAIAPTADAETELINGAHGYVIGKPYTLDLDSII